VLIRRRSQRLPFPDQHQRVIRGCRQDLDGERQDEFANATAREAGLLANGEVFGLAGGYNGAVLKDAERYDPVSGTWVPTGSLHVGRFVPTPKRS